MSEPEPTTISRGFLVTALICGLLLIGLRMALRPDYSRRNVTIFPEMVVSPALKSFGSSMFLPGGMVEQALVPGVRLHGEPVFRFGAGPEEALRAGVELQNPLAADDKAAGARGAELYRVFCVVCHGADGAGRGSVVLRGMLPPPSLFASRGRAMRDGEMFHVLTLGQGNMASYAAQLTPLERWQVIAHVRTLQEEQ